MSPSSPASGANAVPDPDPCRVLARAAGLGFSHPGHVVLSGVSFDLRPGLTLVRGGDGRGKTTLLRLLAGTLSPGAGTLQCLAAPVFHENLSDAVHDDVVARDWLQRCAGRFPGWRDDPVAALIDAFSLREHLDKRLHMISTGGRRKVGLVAAVACGAPVTLLDMPFAALDAPSRAVLRDVLEDAAASTERAWVITDHEAPQELGDVRWAGVIDLGD